MYWVLFLLSIIYNGLVASIFFLPQNFKKIFIATSFICGSVISISLIVVLLIITKNLSLSLTIYFVVSVLNIIFTYKKAFKVIKKQTLVKVHVLYLILFLLTFGVFERSLSYEVSKHIFLIESNIYWDFGTHIPFARLLTTGGNYIPEVPFFGGKDLMYHFIHDFYIGILEYLGLRIDYAVNLISSFSFLALVSAVIEFTNKIFKNRFVGALTIFLFIFNGDLSFIEIFQKMGISLKNLYNHNSYPAVNFFGVLIDRYFLNVNVLLNQRHIIFALAFCFFIILISISKSTELFRRHQIFLGILIGLFVFWHESIILCIILVLLLIAILFKEFRKNIIPTILGAIFVAGPQFLLIRLTSSNSILLRPGFLVADNLSITRFIMFWIWNLGFAPPVFVISFFSSNTFQKKMFYCFSVLFILACSFQFAKDIFDNHKFFNVWIICFDMFVAWGIYKLIKGAMFNKIMAAVFIVLISLSGALHLLVVKNDVYARIQDYKYTAIGSWMDKHIKPEELSITNGDIYDPASIVGKKTFLGIEHVIFTSGGDPNERIKQREEILAGKNKLEILNILKSQNVKYIIIYKNNFAKNESLANLKFLDKNFKKLFNNNEGVIYKV